jgi:hypothetical protein
MRSTENKDYALKLGVSYRRVLRLGGAAKLKAMDESSRHVLVAGSGPTPRKWGLKARGMNVKKPFAVLKEEAFEMYVQALLRERGLA